MIFNNSRYADGPLGDITDNATGTVRKVVFRRWPMSTAQFATYVWKDGDRIDLIAQKFFGDPGLWWQVMDWNPEIVDPTSIRPGTQLRLPV